MTGYYYSVLMAGQALCMVLFLLLEDRNALRHNSRRIIMTITFPVFYAVFQHYIHIQMTTAQNPGFWIILYLTLVLLIGTLFFWLWKPYPVGVSLFLAILFMVGEMVPSLLISGREKIFIVIPYPWKVIIYTVLILFLKVVLTLLLHYFITDARNLRLSRSHGALIFASAIPFLYIRIIYPEMQDSLQNFRLVATLYCLITILSLARVISNSTKEVEKYQSEKFRNILLAQQTQYQKKLSDEELINRKYHDMKSMLLYLNDGHSGEVKRLLGEMKTYEADISTGNEVIDIILREKLEICRQKEITCVPYVNGRMFEKADPLDLCVIFGNALDNAIESTEQIPDGQDRQISITSGLHGGATVLVLRNTFSKVPVFENGLPVTSKENKKEHGIGLRSIRMIAEKYNGSVSCKAENIEFVLTVILNNVAEI